MFVLGLLAAVAWAQAGPGEYAGSAACSGCHRRVAEYFRTTPMGRSMRVPKTAEVAAKIAVPVERMKRTFETAVEEGAIFQAETGTDDSGAEEFRSRHRIEYAVGSGVNGSSFIVRRGAYLFQAPLSYYARTRTWDLSPGYEFADYGFNRPILPACVACHAGRPNPGANAAAGEYRDPPFAELAIGCENCHGPGAAHLKKPSRATIVNPARLAPRLAEDICQNCHQTGDTRVLQPGKSHFDFRPGSRLNDTVAVFKIPLEEGAKDETDLLEHHFSMQLSACFAGSGGKLSCLTCHNPHATPTVATFRARCQSCHVKQGCKLPLAQRPGNDCASCHMPKRPAPTIAHSALTNHRIVRRAGQPLPAAAFRKPDAVHLPGLIHLNSDGKPLPLLVRLQAYGELTSKDARYRDLYFATLDQAATAEPSSAMVQAALGSRAAQQDEAKAIEHLGKAVEAAYPAAETYQTLAELLSKAGKEEEAVVVLQKGLAVQPFHQALHKSLALRYINLKRYDRARQTMERYLDLFPEDSWMRGLLRKVR